MINRTEREVRQELKCGGGPTIKINNRTEKIRKVLKDSKISLRRSLKKIVILFSTKLQACLVKNKYSSRSARKKPLLPAVKNHNFPQ